VVKELEAKENKAKHMEEEGGPSNIRQASEAEERDAGVGCFYF
jgi:hypothetical protein